MNDRQLELNIQGQVTAVGRSYSCLERWCHSHRSMVEMDVELSPLVEMTIQLYLVKLAIAQTQLVELATSIPIPVLVAITVGWWRLL